MDDRGVRRSAAGSRNTRDDLLAREEEFRQRNAEFEAKTAALVSEADSLLQMDREMLLDNSLLSNVNADDLMKEIDEGGERRKSKTGIGRNSGAKDAALLPPRESVDGTTALLNQIRRNLNEQLDGAEVELPAAPKPRQQEEEEEEEESLVGVPSRAVGAEARARVLQAEVRVLREENEKLAAEVRKRGEENSKLSARYKEQEEERKRLERIGNAHRQQMEKYKRLAEETKSKADSLENQLQGVRKELDGVKREAKQQAGSQNAVEVRLNRALEEAQRLRSQLQDARNSSKDSDGKMRRQVEQLLAENKRLEKQKNDLVVGFKKQLKLIDVLKRQRMHVEAARMLQFAEEEFVKALDWGQ